jgi:hypothetical protein
MSKFHPTDGQAMYRDEPELLAPEKLDFGGINFEQLDGKYHFTRLR